MPKFAVSGLVAIALTAGAVSAPSLAFAQSGQAHLISAINKAYKTQFAVPVPDQTAKADQKQLPGTSGQTLRSELNLHDTMG